MGTRKNRLGERRGGSNEYPQSMFLIRNKKTYAGILVLQVLIRTNPSLLWRHSMSLVLR